MRIFSIICCWVVSWPPSSDSAIAITDQQIVQQLASAELKAKLIADHKQLWLFSSQMRLYGITQERFVQYFREGLASAIAFYQSPRYISEISVNRLIRRQLRRHKSWPHTLKEPRHVKTTEHKANTSLQQFSGDWYGLWKSTEVHHRWLSIQSCHEVLSKEFSLVSFQSCFTGDGIGWNFVVNHRDRTLILGFVYHFGSDGQLTSGNPHYAFLNDNLQLTWVSDGNIYHEFVCSQSQQCDQPHYVITGVQYAEEPNQSATTNGFQAIYLPENKDLPAFKSLEIPHPSYFRQSLIKKLIVMIRRSFFKRW